MQNFGYDIVAKIKQEVEAKMREVGEEAVNYAVENGTYKDVTGRLRSSNRYRISDRGLELYNTAPYAQDVEARGEDVLSGAALFAESKLK